ncbi:protein of unknown function [Citrobacter amalonaticus]|uniref:Uncharacterized protein n=1 Tax=Citrobacter amalonaticus TaxID=35703 RepID=A0AAX2BG87_CITAM|nr:protein of unknown function [Citrobacter amalonaticus]SAZ29191.1 protein of unknown function [Citrobacter amalonaticus]
MLLINDVISCDDYIKSMNALFFLNGYLYGCFLMPLILLARSHILLMTAIYRVI